MTELRDEHLSLLAKLTVGGCTCMTKTPELKYHAPDCQYRVASEIMLMIDPGKPRPDPLQQLIPGNSLKARDLRESIEWLERLCTPNNYLNRLGPVRDWVRAMLEYGMSPPPQMSVEVALHFADYPRPYHTLQAPADANGELYRALRVLAREYRKLLERQTPT